MTATGLFAEALATLSPEDQQRAQENLLIYGTAMIERPKDGPARLLSPMEIFIAYSASVSIAKEIK